jgi:post-segregation antitoxin (ccd killing protein)
MRHKANQLSIVLNTQEERDAVATLRHLDLNVSQVVRILLIDYAKMVLSQANQEENK